MVTKDAMNLLASKAKVRKHNQFVCDIFNQIEMVAEEGKFSTYVLLDNNDFLHTIRSMLLENGFTCKYDEESYKMEISWE